MATNTHLINGTAAPTPTSRTTAEEINKLLAAGWPVDSEVEKVDGNLMSPPQYALPNGKEWQFGGRTMNGIMYRVVESANTTQPKTT